MEFTRARSLKGGDLRSPAPLGYNIDLVPFHESLKTAEKDMEGMD